jgi:hypothetical protein
VDRYKARIVAKGFNQRPGYEVYAPTMRQATNRLVFALSAIHDLYLHSIDISMAFTNGDLDETILMQQPECFNDGNPNHVLHLLKSLYGLKQAARMWNKKLHAVLLELGFVRLEAEHSMYIKTVGNIRIILPLWVDDITNICIQLQTCSLGCHPGALQRLQTPRFG